MKKKHIYIFIIFTLVLWNPIYAYFFPYDGNRRFISVLAILFLLIGFSNVNKSFFRNGKYYDLPCLLWVLWVIINTLFFNPMMHPRKDISLFFIDAILPFIVYFGIRLNLTNVNINKQWLWLFFAILSYLFLVFIFEKEDALHANRLGNYINPNEIAWIALLGLFCSYLVKGHKKLRYFVIIAVFILLLMTASKKAMISFFVFYALKFLIISNVTLIKRIGLSSLFLVLMSLSIPFLMDNTFVGERIQESMEANSEVENDTELFDGRAEFYIVGFELFKNRPLVGIGIFNFIHFGKMGLVAHSEYVVQFAELGLIGLILFLIFHFRIFVSLLKLLKNKKAKHISLLLLVILIIFYGMFLGRWVYSDITYHIFLAIMVNTIISFNMKGNIKKNI